MKKEYCCPFLVITKNWFHCKSPILRPCKAHEKITWNCPIKEGLTYQHKHLTGDD